MNTHLKLIEQVWFKALCAYDIIFLKFWQVCAIITYIPQIRKWKHRGSEKLVEITVALSDGAEIQTQVSLTLGYMLLL